ncbi:phage holin family protein [Xanthomonas sp. 60]
MSEFINAATLFSCLVICMRLLTYRPHAGARHRPAVAWLAWALIVATGGQALTLVLFGTGSGAADATTRLCQLALLVVLAIVIYRAHGNAARLLPKD